MNRPGGGPEEPGAGLPGTHAAFTALLEDSAEELYESAPCGYLSTLLDGTIAKINATLLGWLGLSRGEVVGRMRFSDLLTVGGKLYHETHFAPLLRIQGHLNGIALDLRTATGSRLPVLVTSTLKRSQDGEPLLIRTTVFDATERRAYEQELLRARRAAEEARRAAEEARRQAEADRERLCQTLAVLQHSLLPETLPDIPGVRTACHYHTASTMQLGGDFYDLFELDDRRTAFFLGDVCGKGPQAAALTSLTRYTLRTALLHDVDPVANLGTLNTVLLDRYTGDDPRYCTAAVGVMERVGDTLEVRLASGGHPPALVIRVDGRVETLDTRGGMLVGALPAARFVPARTTLRPGDTLLLYTDGLTEARVGPHRELYGDEALVSFAAGLAPTGPHRLVEALKDLLRGFGDGLDDDTALLAIGLPARTDTGPGIAT
ncbi:PP2C family protein-serine/threonine phosphatase [Streptomyces pilosus]|uniref:Histidine kinase n=1 Tax=Streptomyces pilosus TaxID=28893 RepID=A0A918BIN1_9ACTN|nr:SpoIIE family protein phosphatase [Streptomyces pilosus]GGQ69269.1 histidine kinase [Streptomyces pilosus]